MEPLPALTLVIHRLQHARRELAFAPRDAITVGAMDGLRNDVLLVGRGVSKTHARIVMHQGQLHVVDMKSLSGTWVNGKKLKGPSVISPDDDIHIGGFTLHVRLADSARTSHV